MTAATLPAPPSRDVETIALVGFVHGVSHFFHLLLPPLFPWLMQEFGLSFTVMGATMTVFFVISGVGQALSGFFVDRFGAALVLTAGISSFALAGVVLHFAAGYPSLIAAAALAGLGNCVFHPADFTVLNRMVSSSRLGHAFSVPALSGNIGWALAPLFMTGIASSAGWRWAALGATLVALAALAVLIWRRDDFSDPRRQAASRNDRNSAALLDFLRSSAVWMCFAFFFLVTTAFGAIQNFATPILGELFSLPLTTAAAALSAYLLGSAGGVLVGGFLAQKDMHGRLVAAALTCAAVLALLLACAPLPAWSVLPVMAAIGFFVGGAGPSRDLLVRRAATSRFGQAAYGRVYGFVYSGLDAGLALSPLVFGSLMDARHFREVLVGVAILQCAAILTALRVGKAGG